MVQFPESNLKDYLDNPSSFTNDLPIIEKSKENSLYLDKAWEAIHFILTGENIGAGDKPMSLTIYSEQFFDENEDLGVGPASYISASQVDEISKVLEAFDKSEIKKRFHPEKMDKMQIYPAFWDSNPTETFKYLAESFTLLQSFFAKARSKNYAIATYLS